MKLHISFVAFVNHKLHRVPKVQVLALNACQKRLQRFQLGSIKHRLQGVPEMIALIPAS